MLPAVMMNITKFGCIKPTQSLLGQAPVDFSGSLDENMQVRPPRKWEFPAEVLLDSLSRSIELLAYF